MFGIIKKIFIGWITGLVSASNHTNCVSLSNHNVRFNLLLSIYVLMNAVKNFTTIHIQLN